MLLNLQQYKKSLVEFLLTASSDIMLRLFQFHWVCHIHAKIIKSPCFLADVSTKIYVIIFFICSFNREELF